MFDSRWYKSLSSAATVCPWSPLLSLSGDEIISLVSDAPLLCPRKVSLWQSTYKDFCFHWSLCISNDIAVPILSERVITKTKLEVVWCRIESIILLHTLLVLLKEWRVWVEFSVATGLPSLAAISITCWCRLCRSRQTRKKNLRNLEF